MKISLVFLPALLLLASVSPSSANIDFTLGTKHDGPAAPDPDNHFITDGDNRIYLRIPRGWSATGAGDKLTLLPDQASSEVQISQIGGAPALPLDPNGLAALRKRALATLPEGAKDIKPVGEVNDLLPVFGWKSFELTFDYDFFGQQMRRSMLYVNMIPGRVVQVSLVSTVTDFDKVHENMRKLMLGWFEPNRDLAPADAKAYEEGGFKGS